MDETRSHALTDHRFENKPLPRYTKIELTSMRNATMQKRFSEIFWEWKGKRKFNQSHIIEEMQRRWPEYVSDSTSPATICRLCTNPKLPKK